MSDYTKRAIGAYFFVLIGGFCGMLAIHHFTPADTLEHVRYEKNGKTIDESQYRREFQKNPASVFECTRNTRTGEVLCAAG